MNIWKTVGLGKKSGWNGQLNNKHENEVNDVKERDERKNDRRVSKEWQVKHDNEGGEQVVCETR